MTQCLRIFMVLVGLVVSIHSQAQLLLRHVVGSAGSELQGSEATIQYHVGEVATGVFSFQSTYYNAGFIQPDLEITTTTTYGNQWIELVAFPNPATHFIRVECSDYTDASVWEITDLNGKMILGSNRNHPMLKNFDIDIQGIPAGLYILRLVNATGNKFGFTRFVKI